jgi:hypothetical protein
MLYNYVFVRKDIPIADQLVQVGHACLKAGYTFPCPTGEPFMVLLGLKDSQELEDTKEYLKAYEIEFVTFYEPDENMGETAICTTYVSSWQRKIFEEYELWTLDIGKNLSKQISLVDA